jgi:hypothetical protein
MVKPPAVSQPLQLVEDVQLLQPVIAELQATHTPPVL